MHITNHGRASHVLATIEYFQRLHGEGTPAGPDGQVSLFGLADWLDEAIIAVSEDEHLLYFNRVADAVCRQAAPLALSVPISAALPAIRGTLFEVNYRRTLISREPTSVDLPSPFKPDAWLHLSTFPLRQSTVLMFRDITEEVQRQRSADVKKAVFDAVSHNGDTGYVRLSVRGTIDQADEAFCGWVGLGEKRLHGVPLVDLIDRADRVTFRDRLESVLGGGVACEADVKLIAHGADTMAVHGGVAPLHGSFGAEGAVIVFTSCAASRT